MSGPAGSRRTSILLALILVLAAGLRVTGLDFGLPYLYHPDEPGKIEIAQQMLKTGDLNPHYFRKPTLLIYLNAAVYVPYYAIGKATGRFQSPADIPPVIREGQSMGVGYIGAPDAVLWGRSISVVVGTLAVLLTFLVGRRFFDRPGAPLLGALLMAVSPVNIVQSHYIETNVLLVAAILGVLWFSANILDRGARRDYLMAGFMTGIAVTCKYPGIIAAVFPLAAHGIRSGYKLVTDRKILGCLGMIAVGFFLGTPFALLDPVHFVTGAGSEAWHYASGHDGSEGFAPFWYIGYGLRREGLFIGLGGIAIVQALRQRRERLLLLASFPAVYFAFISLFQVRNTRTFLPITPFLFLLGAGLAVEWWHRVAVLTDPIRRRALAAALLAVGLFGLYAPAAHARTKLREFTVTDSRETSRRWIEENVPHGSTIAIESYAPFVDTAAYRVEPLRRLADVPPDWYRKQGVQYLVFSHGMYDRYFDDPARYPADTAAYNTLWREFPEVRRFTDGGYEIRIHAVRP